MNKWMLLMPLALLACGDKTDDTAGDAATIEPQEGAWTMSDLEFAVDTCGFDEGGDTGAAEPEPAPINLTKNEDGSYALRIDEDLNFSCALSGADLTCDPYEMVDSEPDSDMTLTQTFNIGAVFTSNTSLDGSVSMETTCDGADCEMFESAGMTLPCSMEGTFSATAG